jgi:hypothetical protein
VVAVGAKAWSVDAVGTAVDIRQLTGRFRESFTYLGRGLRTWLDELMLDGEGREGCAVDLTCLGQDPLDVLLDGAG